MPRTRLLAIFHIEILTINFNKSFPFNMNFISYSSYGTLHILCNKAFTPQRSELLIPLFLTNLLSAKRRNGSPLRQYRNGRRVQSLNGPAS